MAMAIARLNLPARSALLAQVLDFLNRFGANEGLSSADSAPFALALEELFLNVAIHGSEDTQNPPQILITLEHDGHSVHATISDNGKPFNPLSLAPADISLPLEDRKVGGLGVKLVTELMDAVTYQFDGQWNTIHITKTVNR
jgi:serine/threonine-protein kinase RsbW